jgi:hypothetical protein
MTHFHRQHRPWRPGASCLPGAVKKRREAGESELQERVSCSSGLEEIGSGRDWAAHVASEAESHLHKATYLGRFLRAPGLCGGGCVRGVRAKQKLAAGLMRSVIRWEGARRRPALEGQARTPKKLAAGLMHDRAAARRTIK